MFLIACTTFQSSIKINFMLIFSVFFQFFWYGYRKYYWRNDSEKDFFLRILLLSSSVSFLLVCKVHEIHPLSWTVFEHVNKQILDYQVLMACSVTIYFISSFPILKRYNKIWEFIIKLMGKHLAMYYCLKKWSVYF